MLVSGILAALLAGHSWCAETPQTAIYFEQNLGQAGAEVQYLARTPGYNLLLTGREMIADVNGRRLRMLLAGANPLAPLEGVNARKSVTDYYLGNDPALWRKGVPHFARVRRRAAYPGIDVIFYASGNRLEYDFEVASGADPRRIRLQFEGARKLRITKAGELAADTGEREFLHGRPVIYQTNAAGARQSVAGRWVVERGGTARFEIGRYDRSRKLVIDPVIWDGVAVGGSGRDELVAINGRVVAGSTQSLDWPLAAPRRQRDTFLMFLNIDMSISRVVIIGGSGDDWPVAVNEIQIAGTTTSRDLPTARPLRDTSFGPVFQPQYGGGASDGFIATWWQNGFDFHVRVSYFGGSGEDRILAGASNWIAGETNSPNLPGVMARPTGGGKDGFIARIGGQLQGGPFHTYLGGSGDDAIHGIAVGAGGVFAVGVTQSADFPTTDGALSSALQGKQDAFVARMSVAGELLYATMIGGQEEDSASQVSIAGNRIMVAGFTRSSDFPVANGFQMKPGGGSDAFLASFSATLQPEWATFLGGTADDQVKAMAVTASGSVLVGGSTSSRDFPVSGPGQSTYGGGGEDGFLAEFSAGGTLAWSNFLGGGGADSVAGVWPQDPLVVAMNSTAPFVNNAARGGPDGMLLTITRDGIGITDTLIGKGLEKVVTLRIGLPRGSSPRRVTISSGNPGRLNVGAGHLPFGTPSAELTSDWHSIAITLFAGDTEGTVPLTVEVEGAEPVTVPIRIVASRLMWRQRNSENVLEAVATDPATGEQVRAGDLVSLFERIRVRSLNPDIAMADFQSDGRLTLRPVKPGVVEIATGVPPGWTPVEPLRITIPNTLTIRTSQSVAKGLTLTGSVGLLAASGNEPDVVLSSSDPEKLAFVHPVTQQPVASHRTLANRIFQVIALAGSGEVSLRAEAAGYPSAEVAIALTAPVFRIRPLSPPDPLYAGYMFSSSAAAIIRGAGDLELGITPQIPLASPITLELNTSNPAAGSLSRRQIQIPSQQGTFRFTPAAAGVTDISARALEGAAIEMPPFRVTVQDPAISVADAYVGLGLEVQMRVNFLGAAPQTISIRSGDPNRLVVRGGAAALPEITISGQSPVFYARALSGGGTVPVTILAPGFPPVIANVTITRGGIAFLNDSLTVNRGQIVAAGIQPYALDPGTNLPLQENSFLPEVPRLAFAVRSVNPAIATAQLLAAVQVTPVSPGETELILDQPASFAAPSRNQRLRVKVLPEMPQAYSFRVAKGAQTAAYATISALERVAGAIATITSTDPDRVLLAPDSNQPGTPSVTVLLSSGSASFYIQGLGSSGSVPLRVSAPGIETTWQAILLPMEAALSFNPGAAASATQPDIELSIPLTSAPAQVSIVLRVAGWKLHTDRDVAMLPGLELPFTARSSNPSVAVPVPGTGVLRGPGAAIQLRPVAAGTATITVDVSGQPPLSFLMEVRAPRLTMQRMVIGKDLQTLAAAYAADWTGALPQRVTVTSSDPSKLLLSTDARRTGTASVTVSSESGAFTCFVQAVSPGDAMLKREASGAAETSTHVTVVPSALVFDNFPRLVEARAGGEPYQARILLAPLERTEFDPSSTSVRAGAPPLRFAITSNAPDVAAAAEQEVTLQPGDTGKTIAIRTPGRGDALITLTPAPGTETAPSNRQTLIFWVR